MSGAHEWLNLVEVSGPFLAVPVLRDAFPQGLEELDAGRARRLRSAYDEWRDAVDDVDPALDALHDAWVAEVLRTALDLDESTLRAGDEAGDSVRTLLAEHDHTVVPEFVVVDPTRGHSPILPVHVFPPDTDLDATRRFDGLRSSAGDRMALQLRALGIPVGLVTNGERWMVVHAPVGHVATFASWYARLWGQERSTLRAFVSLLGVRRFFGPEDERLPSLFERSLEHQDEVTEALGEQVRRAVEVLVQALDRADVDRNRELLRDVGPGELYEAGLTIMMRLVFLLAAEERGLLLLGEPRYDSFYAVSTLRMQLRAESEEILERRRSAWSRLLAVFRAVFGGIDHPTLRLPALGGSLFDPDRFPFLEGRAKGTSWKTDLATPLPIDDRTVLLLLDAIQTFKGRTLSYRALDIEQIGHVYEGLLERTVERVHDVTIELEHAKSAKNPTLTLGELESARLDGPKALLSLLVERTGRSKPAVSKAIGLDLDGQLEARLLASCRGDVEVRDRLSSIAHLIRTDPWGYPLVHPKGAFVVVLGAERRDTGTHYTPKSLTETIVAKTLTPLVYDGPASGAPKDAWGLKASTAILDLKVCDPTMGSGAFLVQACRFLSARLVEAWAEDEAAGMHVDVDGDVHETLNGHEPMPPQEEARAEIARRLVAERCLYGVDLNPLAVELAKLSLWLVTLAKGRPFGFLDHNLRQGDSLVGITDIEQLTKLALVPTKQQQGRLFGNQVASAVDRAMRIRTQLRGLPVRDIADVRAMASLDANARAQIRATEVLADAFIGVVLESQKGQHQESKLATFGELADRATTSETALREASDFARRALSPLSRRSEPLSTFHWPLQFPEVFLSGGFDALVGNPPFLTGKRISTTLGAAYQSYLKRVFPDSTGAADLVVYFLRRGIELVRTGGTVGAIATKSIAEGASRMVGLHWLCNNATTIAWAIPELEWPSNASVTVSLVGLVAGPWGGEVMLGDVAVNLISSSLRPVDAPQKEPLRLKANNGLRSDGIKIHGNGFIISEEERRSLVAANAKNQRVIRRYLTGRDIAQNVHGSPSAWIVSFGTMSRAEAESFREPFDLVTERVKPYRDGLTGQIHEADYWKFWDKREVFFKAMAGAGRILACPSTSKYLLMTFISEEWVPSHSVKLFAFSDFPSFGFMQSCVHEAWARARSGKMRSAHLAYNLSRAFATFPMPSTASCKSEGRELFEARDEAIASRTICLTDLYNLVHDPECSDHDIVQLRQLHIALDQACVELYGWSDLRLQHGFHEVSYLPESDRVRFTISERARVELLRRLMELNHKRHASESERVGHRGVKGQRSRLKKGGRDA